MGRVKEIIKELKNNDYRSFDEFYSMTSKLVYYIIAGIIRNKDTVEDLMQDTYLKFIQNINSVNPNKNPNAYLAQIAKNLALNEFKKSKMREELKGRFIAHIEAHKKWQKNEPKAEGESAQAQKI